MMSTPQFLQEGWQKQESRKLSRDFIKLIYCLNLFLKYDNVHYRKPEALSQQKEGGREGTKTKLSAT